MQVIDSSELKMLPHCLLVQFAVFCAKQVQHLIPDEHREVCNKAIEAAEGFIYGTVSKEECLDVAYDAYIARSIYPAAHAAYTATHAVDYAYTDAAYAAETVVDVIDQFNQLAFIKAQWDYYQELLDFANNKQIEEMICK